MTRLAETPAPARKRSRHAAALTGADPLWFKNAVIYELHVRAFRDSNGDGIGDFKGLTATLDYLQDLGVTAIWLLPFYPSPLRDDGYDIADYTGVNPSYGAMRDVRQFVREAHARGLRVITELVLNHTSDQHQWFQRARHAPPGSTHRDFYVWSDDPEKYSGTRIIFQDFEHSNWTWDHLARSYYWHRFYSHQPDLNYDNPAVHEAMLKVLQHWFDAGVDGMRLDAVPYLYEREGTNCENLPETHDFLRKLRREIDKRYPEAMFLAEANQWPEDAAAYFGDGDECHMNFHFPLMPRLFMSVRMEDRFPIMDILQQTPEIPSNCQWAVFLRNHDELTLEMVTDEERDYMYRMYAGDRQARINLGIRRRLAPLLENNRRKIELMNALLFALPGTPVVYYGDEIGMGDNIYLGDRDSVRTPMQWSADRNAGFSRANPQQLYLPTIIDPEYHYESINVEAQQNNATSLLWWMKRLIALRKRFSVFGEGAIEFVNPHNHKVLAFIRRDDEHQVLVIANLSRYVQAAELDLSAYRGMTPIEMFGYTRFPLVGELPYFLTLGPHAFYWFSLEREPERAAQTAAPAKVEERRIPVVEIDEPPGRWLTSGKADRKLEVILGEDVPRRRWFRSKARKIRNRRLIEFIPVNTSVSARELTTVLALIDFEFVEGEPETYAVPLALATPGHAALVFGTESPAVFAHVKPAGTDETLFLYDAMIDHAFCSALLDMIGRRRRAKGRRGQLAGSSSRLARELLKSDRPFDVHVSRAEQSNSSVVYGEELILKLFRSVAPGLNPDLEISRHLTDAVAFPHSPAYAGALEYRGERGEPLTLGLLQRLVSNEGDGWRYTLDSLSRYYERMLEQRGTEEAARIDVLQQSVLDLVTQETPESAQDLFGFYLHSVEILGRRTGEMHLALADDRGNSAFKPEPFSQLYQRSLYQSLRNTAQRSFQLLREQVRTLPDESQGDAEELLRRESEVMKRLRTVADRRLSGMRIRCHGDYHLGQVLWTGRDFMIIDYEGEPARALTERRLKWTPLRDVAGMMRSFQYAAFSALHELVERGAVPPGAEGRAACEPWARYWQAWASASFLRAYLETVREGNSRLLPSDEEGLRTLLDAWVLDKALYEVVYELNNRPAWVRIPLRGALEILDAAH